MVSCFIADDHPAIRTGLLGLLRSEPGFVPVGSSGRANDAYEELRRRHVDLALLDYHLPDRDGLALCCDLKSLDPAPRVVIYSAFAGPRLALAAAVAGADAVLAKGAPVDDMFALLRAVARGEAGPPADSSAIVDSCVEILDPSDLPIFGMALAGTPPEEMATVTGEDVDVVRGRIRALVGSLAPEYRRTEHGDYGSTRPRRMA